MFGQCALDFSSRFSGIDPMFGACRLAKYVRHTKSTMSRVIMSDCVNQAVNVRA